MTRRTRPATLAVTRWLALRLAAWQSGAAFDDHQITPQVLRSLEVATHCPITGRALQDDACVVAIDARRGWVAGNLVLLSPAIAERWANIDWQLAQAALARAEAEPESLVDGLPLRHWTAFVAAFALVVALVLTLVAGPALGRLPVPVAKTWGIVALHVLAVASFASIMTVLIGRWAIIPTWLFFVVLGNSSSGGAVSPPLLPPPFAFVSQWLPSGATSSHRTFVPAAPCAMLRQSATDLPAVGTPSIFSTINPGTKPACAADVFG